jgi:hypothetical protein
MESVGDGGRGKGGLWAVGKGERGAACLPAFFLSSGVPKERQ